MRFRLRICVDCAYCAVFGGSKDGCDRGQGAESSEGAWSVIDLALSGRPRFAGEWTTRELHTRLLVPHQLTDGDCRLSQLRYDLNKLRAKRLIERLGTSRRYRLTPLGLKLGVLLVKLRTRLLGPLDGFVTTTRAGRPPCRTNSVEAALHEIDAA